MKNVRNNDSAFFLFFEKKEIVRDNVSAKQYKMFTLEATKSQQFNNKTKERKYVYNCKHVCWKYINTQIRKQQK